MKASSDRLCSPIVTDRPIGTGQEINSLWLGMMSRLIPALDILKASLHILKVFFKTAMVQHYLRRLIREKLVMESE
jgi:hypothetical protein